MPQKGVTHGSYGHPDAEAMAYRSHLWALVIFASPDYPTASGDAEGLWLLFLNRILSSFPYLVAGNAACLNSGFDFQILRHGQKETPRDTEQSVSHTQIKNYSKILDLPVYAAFLKLLPVPISTLGKVLLEGYWKTIVSCFLRTEPLLKYQTTGLTWDKEHCS